MPAKKILFTTDLSHPSDAGLPLATSIARDQGSELMILHVMELPRAYAPGEWTFIPLEPDVEAIKQMLDKVKPTDPTVPCAHRMVSGDPATEIVRVAAEENVEMIVMSTHGRTGLPHLLMGSVAEAVVRRAPCPVVTFKQRPEGK
jgi:universal stress protein A